MKKLRILFPLILILIVLGVTKINFADVGNFENYNTGSSSSSDWSSSSSSSSSSNWSSSSDYSSSSSSSSSYDHSLSEEEKAYQNTKEKLWYFSSGIVALFYTFFYTYYEFKYNDGFEDIKSIIGKTFVLIGVFLAFYVCAIIFWLTGSVFLQFEPPVGVLVTYSIRFCIISIAIGLILMIYAIINVLRHYASDRIRKGVVLTAVQQTVLNKKIISKIKDTDKDFDAKQFESWVENLFIKIQSDWSRNDWSDMLRYESANLYEMHSSFIKDYINKNQRNIVEVRKVNWVYLKDFRQDNEKDVIDVYLQASMIDYIIDNKTNKVVLGDKSTKHINSYQLTFIRKKGLSGAKTADGDICPSCGAKIHIGEVGKCEYCGALVTTSNRYWVLSGMERISSRILK
ncbi:MAG: TIM44-like domain-containing protein [Clostridia bacterium]|nr:TIM44-like domain-containing protein [Clostridia bacterium]